MNIYDDYHGCEIDDNTQQKDEVKYGKYYIIYIWNKDKIVNSYCQQYLCCNWLDGLYNYQENIFGLSVAKNIQLRVKWL